MKQLHDTVLHLGQLDAHAVLLQGAVAGIQQEGRLADLSPLSCRSIAAGTAVEGIHPSRQLRRREGLGHIVVRAGHQAGHLIHLLRSGQ